MKHICLFFEPVLSPWSYSYGKVPAECHPKNLVQQSGDFYVSQISVDEFLYFIKIGEKYYAFNCLAGFEPRHIHNVAKALSNPDFKTVSIGPMDWIVRRAVETILNWKERIANE